MNTYTVLVTARSFAKGNAEPLELLEKAACTVIRPKDDADLRARLPDADGIIAGLETYDAALLARAAKLKIISRYGVGYDAIDLDAAHKRGIKVAFTPGANSDSVADLAMTLMLAAARHVPYMDAAIKSGKQDRPQGVEMWRKTLGIIGTGRIGKGVIKRASGFEMKFLCYDTYKDESFVSSLGGKYVDPDTLYRQSDFITIHSPLNDETRGMISAAEFKKMKPTAVIVNTARGGIIDEAALADALKAGVIGAAALDATVEEPPYGSPLCGLPNCILSPHAGAATAEAAYNMGMLAVRNLLAVLETGSCDNLV
ncbi:2-hydroxyacid dehydrogenase [Spirochaetia bacterium]|nr:2-hydroxyacid dehydrogenase [Spirochaetia bacterium]